MCEIEKTPNIESNELTIDSINDDSLLNIFNYLSLIDLFKSRVVSKRWKQLIEYKLNKRISIAMTVMANDCENCDESKHLITNNDCLSKYCQTIKDGSRNLFIIKTKMLNNIFDYCLNIKVLNLKNTIFGRNVWELFRTKCPPSLEHIDFCNSQGLIDEVIRFIVNTCGSTLEHIFLDYCDVSESTLKFVLENCPKLEILNVSNNVRINGDSFSLFGNHIKRLTMNDCRSIGFTGIQSLVSGNAKHLTHLEINGDFIDKKMFELLFDHLNCLTHFEVDFSHINGIKFLTKISNFTQLEELVLYLPETNFDKVFIEIMKKCQKLQKIRIEGILSDLSLKHLPKFCSDLKSLSISSGEIVMNKKITNTSCEAFSRLTQLKCLEIEYTSIGDKMIDVIKSCSQLSNIHIDGCGRITNKFIDSCIEIAKERSQTIVVSAHETRLTMPQIVLPLNLELLMD